MAVRDLVGWDADLRALADGLGGLFQRPEPRRVFVDFVRALLADVPKKNSWGLAERAGYPTPRPFEHLLDGAVWDVDALRDAVRDYVVEHLGTEQAALVADDTSVIKKGTRSVAGRAAILRVDRAERELPGDADAGLRLRGGARVDRPRVVPAGRLDG